MNKAICEMINQKYGLNLNEKMSWKEVSSIPNIPEEMIREFCDELDFNELSHSQSGLSTQLLKDYETRFDFSASEMAKNMLDDDLLKNHQRELDWEAVSRYCNLSKDALDNYRFLINWKTAFQYQNFSETFLDEQISNINPDYLNMDRQFSDDFLVKNQKSINWDRFNYEKYFSSMSSDAVEACKDSIKWEKVSHLTNLSDEMRTKYADYIAFANEKEQSFFQQPDVTQKIVDTENNTIDSPSDRIDSTKTDSVTKQLNTDMQQNEKNAQKSVFHIFNEDSSINVSNDNHRNENIQSENNFEENEPEYYDFDDEEMANFLEDGLTDFDDIPDDVSNGIPDNISKDISNDVSDMNESRDNISALGISENASIDDLSQIDVKSIDFDKYCEILEDLSTQTFVDIEDYDKIPAIIDKINELKQEYPRFKKDFENLITSDDELNKYIIQYVMEIDGLSRGEDRTHIDKNIAKIDAETNQYAPQRVILGKLIMEQDSEYISQITGISADNIKKAATYRTQEDEKLIADSKALIDDAKNATKEGVISVQKSIVQTSDSLRGTKMSFLLQAEVLRNIQMAKNILQEEKLLNKNEKNTKIEQKKSNLTDAFSPGNSQQNISLDNTFEDNNIQKGSQSDISDAATATIAATADAAVKTAEATVDLYKETNAYEQATTAFKHQIIDKQEYEALTELLKEDTGIVYAMSEALRSLTQMQRDVVYALHNNGIVNSVAFQKNMEFIHRHFGSTTALINKLAVNEQNSKIDYYTAKRQNANRKANKVKEKLVRSLFKGHIGKKYAKMVGLDEIMSDKRFQNTRWARKYKEKFEDKLFSVDKRLNELVTEKKEFLEGISNNPLTPAQRKEYDRIINKINKYTNKKNTLLSYKKGTTNIIMDNYTEKINTARQKLLIIDERKYTDIERMYEHNNRKISRLEIANLIRETAVAKSRKTVTDKNGDFKSFIDYASDDYKLYKSLGGLDENEYVYRNKDNRRIEKAMSNKNLNYGSIAIILNAYSRDTLDLTKALEHSKSLKAKDFINKISRNKLSRKVFDSRNIHTDEKIESLTSTQVMNLIDIVEKFDLTPSKTNALVVKCLNNPDVSLDTLKDDTKKMITGEKSVEEVSQKDTGFFIIDNIPFNEINKAQMETLSTIKRTILTTPNISNAAKGTLQISALPSKNVAQLQIKGTVDDYMEVTKILETYDIKGRNKNVNLTGNFLREFDRWTFDRNRGFLPTITYKLQLTDEEGKALIDKQKLTKKLDNLNKAYPGTVSVMYTNPEEEPNNNTIYVKVEGKNINDTINHQIVDLNGFLMGQNVNLSESIIKINKTARTQLHNPALKRPLYDILQDVSGVTERKQSEQQDKNICETDKNQLGKDKDDTIII